MRSGGFELTKMTYTRLEDNLIRHRGDRLYSSIVLTRDEQNPMMKHDTIEVTRLV